MIIEPETYQSYLLRFRRPTKTTPWRITVHPIEATHQQHFSNLDEVILFLKTQLENIETSKKEVNAYQQKLIAR